MHVWDITYKNWRLVHTLNWCFYHGRDLCVTVIVFILVRRWQCLEATSCSTQPLTCTLLMRINPTIKGNTASSSMQSQLPTAQSPLQQSPTSLASTTDGARTPTIHLDDIWQSIFPEALRYVYNCCYICSAKLQTTLKHYSSGAVPFR